MAVTGVLVGFITGLALSQVPRLPLIAKLFVGMAVVAALVFTYIGLGSSNRPAWSLGLMTAVLVLVAIQLWRSRNDSTG